MGLLDIAHLCAVRPPDSRRHHIQECRFSENAHSGIGVLQYDVSSQLNYIIECKY